MKSSKKSDFLLPPPVLALLFIIYTALWTKLYLDIPINTDFGWLLTCLDRFMAGGTYAKDFYETNPPLSFLIYLPAYPLYRTFVADPGTIILLNFALYIGLTAFLLWRFMKLYEFATPMMIGAFSAFLFVNTWLMGSSFGQKDQLVMLFLMPYAMLQGGFLAGRNVPKRLLLPAAILGALAVCIKPHYIVVPALFIAARFFFGRSLIKILKSPDIIAFALTGLAYLLLLRIAFPDFIEIIMPQVAELYLQDEPYPVWIRLPLALYAVGAGFLALFLAETEGTKRLKITLYTLIGLALICILPYYAQNKGLMYQAIPLYGFGVMAAMVALFGLIYQNARIVEASVLVPFALMLLVNYPVMLGYPPGIMKASEYNNFPYHQKIREQAWNGVYMDLDMKPYNLSLPHYDPSLKQASRFGQIWPMFGLNALFTKARTEQERKEVRAKIDGFVDLMAEDIERYNPSVIAIPSYRVDGSGSDKPQKNYYNLLMKNEKFAKKMEEYEFVETLTFDQGLYDKGSSRKYVEKLLTTDLYVLKKPSEPEKEGNGDGQ